ncbi:4Fe-4S binding protein [bacterium]|nr:4Fe-4S binding protein [bacterium]
MNTTPRTHTLVARAAALACACVISLGATAADRFPRPEFEGGYAYPTVANPHPASSAWTYIDTAVLLAALLVTAHLVLRRRSRAGITAMTLFSIAYFGFWRRGCVCSVGSVQNVALAICDRTYGIPFAVLGFFLLPLACALLFGRVFCAAVCPLGAVQDVVVLRPVAVPRWLAHALGMLPYVYLGIAVVMAATGALFPVCRFDPFVSFFRLNGPAGILVLGALFIVLGMFVGRPYCRFACPYGVVLGWLSRLSKWHATITPDECIQCRLCENACPFGAINKPTQAETAEPRGKELRRLVLLLAALPVLIAGGGWLGSRAGKPLSRAHPDVQLALQLDAEERGAVDRMTLQTEAFRATGTPMAAAYADARKIERQFVTGGWFIGAFVGLSLGARLIGFALRRRREDYEPDRGTCFSCGRCFSYCPRERLRRTSLTTTSGTHAPA